MLITSARPSITFLLMVWLEPYLAKLNVLWAVTYNLSTFLFTPLSPYPQIHSPTHPLTHTHMHAHTHARTHKCIHTCTHTNTHTYHTHMHAHTYAHTHTHHTHNSSIWMPPGDGGGRSPSCRTVRWCHEGMA